MLISLLYGGFLIQSMAIATSVTACKLVFYGFGAERNMLIRKVSGQLKPC